MHRLTRMSDEERRRIVADFLEHAFEGLDIDPGFAQRMRSAMPELPDDPTPEQDEAWIELAELLSDEEFRARRFRRMSERHAAEREAGGGGAAPAQDWQRAAALVAEKAGQARAERYWQLLAIINGWPPVPTTVPAWEWLIAALRA